MYETVDTATEPVPVHTDFRGDFELTNGAVAIASITSCTNTSNPSVMIAAGLIARNAVAKGLSPKPWVKTSLAPGLPGRHRLPQGRGAAGRPGRPGLPARRLRLRHLHRQLRPLLPEISEAINANDLTVTAVLSGQP